MRKLALLLTALLVSAVLLGCNGAADNEPTPEPTEESVLATPVPATVAPTSRPPTPAFSGYPAVPTPTPPGIDSGYPGQTPFPTADPYPGGLATILHPKGLQCEEPIFPDLTAAIDSLEAAGIPVAAAEEIGLEVCEACGCVTSIHYRVQISYQDLDKAIEMGWIR